ncbi:site-specific integrase [Herbaspirillum sp. C9C3]|uniref:site-specific integrase n=1 Tax=Herbaspirillum sp. C9C3 TaxID=2735271 RepID=UPI00158597D0|nr:site-specific integrase [Herbaspirillum sp. C9C3]NUT61443.1 tyrosine-type recombinase/integrase [Herbaspirillum sp. C9C3]
MPQIKAPRLYLNRCGVFYFRLKTKDKDRKVSLRTKCPVTANIVALQLNAVIERGRAMNNKNTRNPSLADFNFNRADLRQYEIEVGNIKIKAEGPEDHARAMEAVEAAKGLLALQPEPPSPAVTQLALDEQAILAQVVADAQKRQSPKLSRIAAEWIVERRLKNSARTVDAKASHLKDFTERALKNEDPEVNELDKAHIVAYKSALLKEGQAAKTIDNKLLSIADFFEYALGQGAYTRHNSNPVTGLYVLSKKERVKQTESYEPFAKDELAALFEPLAYKAAMKAPDLYWGPLLGIYTGMRISEATQIRCQDVIEAENGVHYIYVYRSKTSNGIRKVPICDALVQLGFLDYVEEVRQAGAERIFPHRFFVNGSYSKRLSEELLKYLKARKIKKSNDHKSFHSFRVNVITQLANHGISATLASRVVGHGTEKGMEVHLGYVRDLPDLKKVVDSLAWPVNIEALRYCGQFKNFVANKKKWAEDA